MLVPASRITVPAVAPGALTDVTRLLLKEMKPDELDATMEPELAVAEEVHKAKR